MRVIIELADGRYIVVSEWDCAILASAIGAAAVWLFTFAVRCAGG